MVKLPFGSVQIRIPPFVYNTVDMDALKVKLFDEGVLASALEAIRPTVNYKGTILTWETPTTKGEIIDIVKTIFDDCPLYCSKAVNKAGQTLNLTDDVSGLAGYIANTYANAVFSTTQSENTSVVKTGHGYLAIKNMDGWAWGDGN